MMWDVEENVLDLTLLMLDLAILFRKMKAEFWIMFI